MDESRRRRLPLVRQSAVAAAKCSIAEAGYRHALAFIEQKRAHATDPLDLYTVARLHIANARAFLELVEDATK